MRLVLVMIALGALVCQGRATAEEARVAWRVVEGSGSAMPDDV